MAGKKTSVEQTRDEEKLAQVGNMLDAAFGDVGGLQAPVEPETEEPTPDSVEKSPGVENTLYHLLLRILSRKQTRAPLLMTNLLMNQPSLPALQVDRRLGHLLAHLLAHPLLRKRMWSMNRQSKKKLHRRALLRVLRLARLLALQAGRQVDHLPNHPHRPPKPMRTLCLNPRLLNRLLKLRLQAPRLVQAQQTLNQFRKRKIIQ